MSKEDVLKFIKKQKIAVVATVDAGNKPEAAVVEFGELDDLSIIIDTFKTSRKYKNLQANKNAAVVIGWDNDITVQMNGVVSEPDGEQLEHVKQSYFAKNPRAKKWSNKPEITFLVIKPYWIRYSDVSEHPWRIKEIEL